MPWLTGDTWGGGTICRRLVIPNDISLIAAVNGALLPLTYESNWEQFGTATPEAVADAMRDMWLAYVADDCTPESTGDGMRELIDTKSIAGSNSQSLFLSDLANFREIQILITGAAENVVAFADIRGETYNNGTLNSSHSFGIGLGGNTNWMASDNQGVGTRNSLKIEIPFWDALDPIFLVGYRLLARRSGYDAYRFNGVADEFRISLSAGVFATGSTMEMTGIPL
jgi:hypothetical protein